MPTFKYVDNSLYVFHIVIYMFDKWPGGYCNTGSTCGGVGTSPKFSTNLNKLI